MTYKLPEPAGVVDRFLNVWTLENHKPIENGAKIFTAAQMHAHARDVLEMAAKECGNQWGMGASHCADALRKLKESIK